MPSVHCDGRWFITEWVAVQVDMCRQIVSRRRDDSAEDDDEEEVKVMLFWNEGKKQKSIRDLVLDRQPEDEEILTYYRYTLFTVP